MRLYQCQRWIVESIGEVESLLKIGCRVIEEVGLLSKLDQVKLNCSRFRVSSKKERKVNREGDKIHGIYFSQFRSKSGLSDIVKCSRHVFGQPTEDVLKTCSTQQSTTLCGRRAVDFRYHILCVLEDQRHRT